MPRRKTTDTETPAATPKRARATKPAPEQPSAVIDIAPESEVAVPIQSIAPQSAESIDKMVVFFLGDQRYGLPINVVQEIQQLVAFSEVPQQGGAVVGMVNLRGSVIPALDMRMLVGLPAVEYRLETPMIMCRTAGMFVALLVDEVEDVLTLPEGCLQAAPEMHSLSSKMIGVCRMDDHLIYLLEAGELLASLGRGI
ncbi:MAG: chemotaxis protein CheW [Coriobacteriia bacterium]|nr:chemotaxis protein CheW [Coriobacteriia bacterium]